MITLIFMLPVLAPIVATAQATQPAHEEVINPIHRTTSSSAGATPSAPSHIDPARIVLALAAVIALIIVLRWIAGRMSPGVIGRSSRAIQVLARCPISHKQQIVLVQVGRRMLVIAEGNHGLSTLSEITDANECAALLGQLGRSDVSAVLDAVSKPPADEHHEPGEVAGDEQLSSARQQLSALTERVRVVARQLNRA